MDNKDSAGNIKTAIKRLKQEEKDAISKAENDARQAVRKAIETRERELVIARETEIKTLRDMRQQFEDAVKSIREAHQKNLDEIKKTRADAVAAAKDLEEKAIREAYDAESRSIMGADTRSIRKIKYETLKSIQEAMDNRERAVRDALFEEEHATSKAIDIAYRDMQREKELQKRIEYRTRVNARNAYLQAVKDADLRERNTVDNIVLTHRQNVANIRKHTLDAIENLKKPDRGGSPTEPLPVIPVEATPEKIEAAALGATPTDECIEEPASEPKEVAVKETDEKSEASAMNLAAQDGSLKESIPAIPDQGIESLSLLANMVMKEIKKVKADRESTLKSAASQNEKPVEKEQDEAESSTVENDEGNYHPK